MVIIITGSRSNHTRAQLIISNSETNSSIVVCIQFVCNNYISPTTRYIVLYQKDFSCKVVESLFFGEHYLEQPIDFWTRTAFDLTAPRRQGQHIYAYDRTRNQL